MLVSWNNKMAAMLLSQISPKEVEPFSSVKKIPYFQEVSVAAGHVT